MKVLVTDGRSLAALAVVRSLGSKGDEIHCGESFKHNLSSYSKHVEKRVSYLDPEEDPEISSVLPTSATQPRQSGTEQEDNEHSNTGREGSE